MISESCRSADLDCSKDVDKDEIVEIDGLYTSKLCYIEEVTGPEVLEHEFFHDTDYFVISRSSFHYSLQSQE